MPGHYGIAFFLLLTSYSDYLNPISFFKFFLQSHCLLWVSQFNKHDTSFKQSTVLIPFITCDNLQFLPHVLILQTD